MLSASQINSIQECLAEDFEHVNPLKISFIKDEQVQYFDAIVHRSQDLIILEKAGYDIDGGFRVLNLLSRLPSNYTETSSHPPTQ